VESRESYRDVVRLGRKTRLQESQRRVLWSIFEGVRSTLKVRDLVTHSDVFSRVLRCDKMSVHAESCPGLLRPGRS